MAITTTASETTIRPAAVPANYGHGHFSSIGHGHGVVDRLRQSQPVGAKVPKLVSLKLAVDEMSATPIKASIGQRPKPISIFPPRPGQACKTTAAQRMAAYREGAKLYDAQRAAHGILFVS